MLCIKTRIANSPIHGIGLYADQFIPKGTLIWKFEPTIDIVLTEKDLQTLSKSTMKQLLNYAFQDRHSKKYILCGDDARFFNHSTLCNCDDSFVDKTIAIRDIQSGEELTVDYRTFYDNFEEYFLKNNIEVNSIFTG